MIIRKAKQSDVDGISQLTTTLVTKYILPTCSKDGGQLILASMAPSCISDYLDAGYQYHVAQLNGELIGVIAMKDNSHLYHLFVAESQQGKGLSRILWELARDACLANGNKGKFTVNSALNAVDVYLKFGFVPVLDINENSGIRERSGVKDMPMALTLLASPV